MAVLEVNASMGLIVAAPTAGSSGVLPGVLLALEEVHSLPAVSYTHLDVYKRQKSGTDIMDMMCISAV